MPESWHEQAGPLLRALREPENLLSLSRIAMAPAVWFVAASPMQLLWLTSAAAITDLADGRLARWRARRRGAFIARTGGIGDWLDPLCDKVFVASALIAAVVTYHPPGYLLVMLLARDLLQALLFLAWLSHQGRHAPRVARRVDFRANVLGKATTVAQFAALVAIVLGSPARSAAAAWAALVLGLASVATYARRFPVGRAAPLPAGVARVAPSDDPALIRGSRWRPRRRRSPLRPGTHGLPRRSRGR